MEISIKELQELIFDSLKEAKREIEVLQASIEDKDQRIRGLEYTIKSAGINTQSEQFAYDQGIYDYNKKIARDRVCEKGVQYELDNEPVV